MTHVSVLICTRGRPDELVRCCASLARLKFRHHQAPTIDVVVVDNNPNAPAPNAAASLTEASGHPTRVVHEPRTGIAYARNAALAHRHRAADYVAFIDDDETATPSWLDHLLIVAEVEKAQLVAGPALPRLPTEASATVCAWYELHRGGRAPSGTRLPAAATGNLLIDAEWLGHTGIEFDENTGLGGGSDIEFTSRAASVGASIVWADRATVWEWIPPRRASIRGILGDAQAWGATKERYASRLGQPRGAWPIVRRTAAQLAAACRERHRHVRRALALHTLAEAAGRAETLAGRIPQHYRHVTRGATPRPALGAPALPALPCCS